MKQKFFKVMNNTSETYRGMIVSQKGLRLIESILADKGETSFLDVVEVKVENVTDEEHQDLMSVSDILGE